MCESEGEWEVKGDLGGLEGEGERGRRNEMNKMNCGDEN